MGFVGIGEKMARKTMEEKEEVLIEEETDVEETDVDVQNLKERKAAQITDLPGVGPAIADKLLSAGYNNVMAVAVASPAEIIAVGVGESVARKMIQHARNSLDMGFESGDEILKRRANIYRILTGSTALNNLLGGGIEAGAITETYGQYGSGKTQIAHAICVNCLKEYPDATVVFIDTENTFRPERIKQLAEGAGLDPDKVLKSMKVARAYNSDHQILLAEKVDELVTKNGLNVKLVVVDSLTGHFRAEFIGRGSLAERQQKLNRHIHTLQRLADVHNLAVYVTNQVMARPDMFFGDPIEAIGGNIVAHSSTFRLYLRRGKKGTRVARLVDSPNLPEGEATFCVEEGGLKDI